MEPVSTKTGKARTPLHAAPLGIPRRFDVLGLGCTAVDDLLYVPRFPAADEKVRVQRSARRFGGLTGVALVTAARAGASCAYAGCLGTDQLSAYAAECLEREGINLSHAPRLPTARVVHSVIVVGTRTGSRNVFFEAGGLIGAHDAEPRAEIIRNCRVLFLDHWGMKGNLRAARIARSAGAAVVADFEDAAHPLSREVFDLVDHLVLSEKTAMLITSQPDAARAARALWRAGRGAVIVTCGAGGCWVVSAENGRAAVHHPAVPVRAADTTGCGDVFHGAYAASLARGDALEARIHFAAAAAALKARDGEIPRLREVQELLEEQRKLVASGNADRSIGSRQPAQRGCGPRKRKSNT